MDTVDIIKANVPLPEAIERAKAYFLSGEVCPLEAWVNMSRFKKMIEVLQDDIRIRDYALYDLSKYGKNHQMPDCRVEQSEVGVRYDYTECGDSTLGDLYAQKDKISMQIKERESMLRAIPEELSMADASTGEMLRRPTKTSKTTIKVTFNK